MADALDEVFPLHGNSEDTLSRYRSIDDFVSHVGESIGVTEWQTVTQDRIDQFAEVTGDHQWIHVDPQRAAKESPFGTTVAHGALTVSICTTLLAELIRIDGVRMVVNAGFDRIRFFAPVPSGSRIRCAATLVDVRLLKDIRRVTVQIRAEIEGTDKVACVAKHILVLYT